MRSLVNVRDIVQEANSPVVCPRCEPGSSARPPVQQVVDWRKGRFFVRKTMQCPKHGAFTTTSQVKTVMMHGKNAEVLPYYRK